MHKSTKKTNLAKLYNNLNSDSKKILMDAFKVQFDLKTEARLYKLLGKPHLLTAFEVEFLSKAFDCHWHFILEKSCDMKPIHKLLFDKKLSDLNFCTI